MKFSHILLAVVLSVAVMFGFMRYVPQVGGTLAMQGTTSGGQAKETRLEQIKRTGVIRCGYSVWPPLFVKDPNTGKLSGVYYDLVEEIGRQLNFKIEWAGEIATGQMLSDLSLNRYDMICGYFGRTPSRAREADFTAPLFYIPIYMYVRADDTRFDRDVFSANRPDVKFATLDGEFSSIAANESFPQAARVSIPQLSTSADLFMSVAGKKADAVVQDSATFAAYDAHNPGVLRPASGKPTSTLALGMPLPANEPALKNMLDTTLAYLHGNGFIDRMLKKYETDSIKYLRAAKPYADSQ